jgi:thiosulfate dehydrogenase [quinone] large subunit
MNLRERTYLWYLVLLRIYVGYYLSTQGYRKFQRDFAKSDWIGRQIGDIASLDLFTWYKTFLQRYVVPHSELVGYLVTVGEITVGVCLLLGLLTRINAAVGLFMVANYYLAIGMTRGGATAAQQQIYLLLLAIFVLANPGRTLGLDGLLFRRDKVRSAR